MRARSLPALFPNGRPDASMETNYHRSVFFSARSLYTILYICYISYVPSTLSQKIYTFIINSRITSSQNRGRKDAVSKPWWFWFCCCLVCLFVSKTWKLDCGVQRSRKVADWAFTRLSEDFKRVLYVSPRKCHKPVHCCFHRKMPARQLVILGKKRKTG